MKKILIAALVSLVTACGDSGGGRGAPLRYAAPVPPSWEETSAAQTAEATLSASLAFSAPTDPTMAGPGLADQLVAELGGYAAAKAMPSPQSAKLAGSATSTAIATGGFDPTCVATTYPTLAETLVTWTGCQETIVETDPSTGDTMTMTVSVGGTMRWNDTTKTTTWDLTLSADMSGTQGGQAMSMDMTQRLTGSLTITATTIKGDSRSAVSASMNYAGDTLDMAYETTLGLDLTYTTPFCITAGKLVLEQRWLTLPAGATAQDFPNQGWTFEWTGCDVFTVAHGG